MIVLLIVHDFRFSCVVCNGRRLLKIGHRKVMAEAVHDWKERKTTMTEHETMIKPDGFRMKRYGSGAIHMRRTSR